jgi:hypothetical protein
VEIQASRLSPESSRNHIQEKPGLFFAIAIGELLNSSRRVNCPSIERPAISSKTERHPVL